MVHRRLTPWTLAFLVLLGLRSPAAFAVPIQFTGNVTQDFNPVTNPNVVTTPVSSNPLNIGQSQWITANGWVSGWSIQDIRTNYDPTTDTLSVGINTFKNANGQYAPFGQANGDPSGTPTRYDPAHLGERQVDRPGNCPGQFDEPQPAGNAGGCRWSARGQDCRRHGHRRLYRVELQR